MKNIIVLFSILLLTGLSLHNVNATTTFPVTKGYSMFLAKTIDDDTNVNNELNNIQASVFAVKYTNLDSTPVKTVSDKPPFTITAPPASDMVFFFSPRVAVHPTAEKGYVSACDTQRNCTFLVSDFSQAKPTVDVYCTYVAERTLVRLYQIDQELLHIDKDIDDNLPFFINRTGVYMVAGPKSSSDITCKVTQFTSFKLKPPYYCDSKYYGYDHASKSVICTKITPGVPNYNIMAVDVTNDTPKITGWKGDLPLYAYSETFPLIGSMHNGYFVAKTNIFNDNTSKFQCFSTFGSLDTCETHTNDSTCSELWTPSAGVIVPYNNDVAIVSYKPTNALEIGWFVAHDSQWNSVGVTNIIRVCPNIEYVCIWMSFSFA